MINTFFQIGPKPILSLINQKYYTISNYLLISISVPIIIFYPLESFYINPDSTKFLINIKRIIIILLK